MATKTTRSGGKFGGSHTTLTDAAIIVADIVVRLPNVEKISPGYISSGLKPTSGGRRVKIENRGSNILLSIRGTITLQEVSVFTGDVQETMLAIAKGARDKGFHISFGNNKK